MVHTIVAITGQSGIFAACYGTYIGQALKTLEKPYTPYLQVCCGLRPASNVGKTTRNTAAQLGR